MGAACLLYGMGMGGLCSPACYMLLLACVGAASLPCGL